MTTLGLAATLIGMVLGIRFRFIILFPVIIFGSAVLIAIATINGDNAGHVLLSIVLFACLLQLGYVCTALVAAPVFRGAEEQNKEEHDPPKPRTRRLAWKLSVPRDTN